MCQLIRLINHCRQTFWPAVLFFSNIEQWLMGVQFKLISFTVRSFFHGVLRKCSEKIMHQELQYRWLLKKSMSRWTNFLQDTVINVTYFGKLTLQ